MKRKIALYLAVILLTGIFPQASYAVLGTPQRLQNPVTEIFSVVDRSPQGAGDSYTFAIDWELPERADVDTGANSNSAHQNAEVFEMDYRNATKNEPPEAFLEGEYQVPPDSTSTRFSNEITANLDPGSLYEFRFTPSHTNYVTTTVNGLPEVQPKTVSGNPANGMSILVLTDLEVDVEGSGNKLTVTWSDPNPAGVDVFDGYEIGYKISDNMGFTRSVYVSADDEGLTRADGKYSYELVDNSLEAGITYDLRVEPMYRNNIVRNTADSSKSVHIVNADLGAGAKDYFLAFRDPEIFEYRKDGILILPYLDYTRIADSQIRLFWSNLAKLGTTTNLLDHLVVEELNPETSEVLKEVLYFNGNYFIDHLNEAIVDLGSPLDSDKAYRLAIYFTDNPDEPQYTNIVIVEPNYVAFGPYSPEIKNWQANEQTQALENLQWLAFARKPLNPDSDEEKVYDKYDFNTIDTQLMYQVYVADNRAALDGIENTQQPIFTLGPPVTDEPIDFTVLDENGVAIGSPQPTYIEESITSYYATLADGTMEKRETLQGNKWYYVKIIAVRDNRAREKSTPAYYEVFMPPFTGLEVNPVMIDAPPLKVVETAPDGSSITVQWDTKYFEIQNPQTKTWHSVIGVSSTTSGAIYGKTAMDVESIQDADGKALIVNDVIKKNSTLLGLLENLDISRTGSDYPADLNNLLNAARPIVAAELAAMGIDTSDLNLRVVDLSRADFDLHTVENSVMRASGGYTPYLNTIGDWSRVSVAKGANGMNPLTITQVVSTSNNPAGPIEENQTYVIYVRPMEIKNGELTAYLPNYVISTTDQSKPRPPADPTTPVLFPDQAFSNALSFYWPLPGIAGMEYEIRYTDRMSDYPNTFVGEFTWEELSGKVKVGKGKAEHGNEQKDSDYYKLEELLPLTNYYIWIRARSVNSGSEEASDWSAWSNYLSMRTLDFDAPPAPAPQIANTTYLTLYNSLNGTEYAPTEANAFTIQWRIVTGDTLPLAASGTPKENTTAENLVMNPELSNLQSYMVRFSDLQPNSDYYVRAKTVKTVAADTPDEYSYVIQVSLDDQFENEADILEFTIPEIPAPGAIPSKESDWAYMAQNPVTTRPSGSGLTDVDPEMYPMPDTDWDITYDAGSQKLKFRFRTSQTGSNGQLDQNADQRFISRLVTNRTFNYEVDLSSYQNKPVTVREVELPYTIMQAFDERKITLDIKAGDYDLSIPPGSFNTANVRSAQMGVGSNLTINLNGEPTGMPSLNDGESFSVSPQKLTTKVNTGTRSVDVDSYAQPIGVSLSMEGHTTPEGTNATLAFSTANSGGWSGMSGQYSYGDNSFNGSITRAGTFAGITRELPSTVTPPSQDMSYEAMRRVTGKIAVTDMPQYNAEETVNAGKFNNMVSAIANNKTSVALSGQMSAAEQQALTKAGLLTNGSLTREAAMNTMVKLYELKTKQILTPMTTEETLPGVESASSAYKNNLLKAADLGFVTGDLNPSGGVTMGDMMNMADIVLGDMR